MIQEQASVEDGGFDKGSSGNVAGLAGIQAIMQSISSLNGKFIIRLFLFQIAFKNYRLHQLHEYLAKPHA